MGETKKYFEKAGAIIIRDNNGRTEILLEYRERDYLKDWTFPKGGVDKGETPEETVKREMREETGLEIELLGKLPTIFYHNSHDGDVKQLMFLAKPLTQDLQPEFKGDKVEWVPLKEVAEKLSYPNLKEYLENIKEKLLIKENNYGKN